MKPVVICVSMLLLFFISVGYTQDIVSHPDMLSFPDLTFDPPEPGKFRTTLDNGIVVYIAEDRELPLIDIHVLIRGGAAWEDPAKLGVASLTGVLLRDGGTKSSSPEELDDEIDFLAANISTSFGNTSGSASLNILSKDIGRGLELLLDILRNPGFDAERFRIQRERIRQNLARRNDQTSQIESREWEYLLYGEDHYSTRGITVETLDAIAPDDLRRFQEKFVHPGNMMIAASGDFDRAEMLALLNSAFAGWEPREAWKGPVPKPDHVLQPGIYIIDKPDVNQGRVSIGHLGTTWDSPDRHVLQVLNGILGGSGFTSRILSRVRSDEGLAYSAGSTLTFGMHYPGAFRAFFQSRNEACAYAAHIVIEEIKRMREEEVSDAELKVQVNSMLEAFPRNFARINQTINLYARDEFEGRDPARWLRYRENISAVSVEDIQAAALRYLDPDKFVMLVVGKSEEILAGDSQYEASFEDFHGYRIVRLPLRNPSTLRIE